jgi:hypothetical protein
MMQMRKRKKDLLKMKKKTKNVLMCSEDVADLVAKLLSLCLD